MKKIYGNVIAGAPISVTHSYDKLQPAGTFNIGQNCLCKGTLEGSSNSLKHSIENWKKLIFTDRDG